MKVISFISQKGGCGKTTLATNLSVIASLNGLKVGLIDVDPQGSASCWGDDREQEYPNVVAPQAHRLVKEIEGAEKQGFDLIIIDTPGELEKATYESASKSDLIIIPVQPSFLDIRTIGNTKKIIEDYAVNSFAILTRTSSNGIEEEGAEDAIKEMGLNISSSRIGDRIAFKRAFSAGLSVVEFEPEGKASAEINILWQQVSNILGLTT